MAGYGNRTAPDYVADDMTDQHESTRLGLHTSHDAYSDAHPKYGSGATGGAGFGTLQQFQERRFKGCFLMQIDVTLQEPGIHAMTFSSVLANLPPGNKSDDSSAPTSNDEFRFDLHKDTSPYSNPGRAGSGSTGGAGYGNKTGEHTTGGKHTYPARLVHRRHTRNEFDDNSDARTDSTLGKIMEKAGHMTHNENLAAKGTMKREEATRVEKVKGEPPFAN
jgi:uncharacterized protein YjbJ (UPF0337 family)